MTDTDVEVLTALKTAEDELKTSLSTVRELANELSTVVDMIEPALSDQAKRLRQARMNSTNELRLVIAELKEFQRVMLDDAFDGAMQRAERFVRLMSDIEEFRACGAIEAFAKAFPEV